MRPAAAQAWRSLLTEASAPYRAAGVFAWRFARGKLGMDPVFRHLLASGLIAPRARVLDIGCGQGLLASLLRAVDQAARRQAWPVEWPAPPQGCHVTGIELMARDVARAQAALHGGGTAAANDATFICADMREAPFPACEVAVILDVLHYIDHAEQNALLARVHAALIPGGRLLLRVGDAQARRRFIISQWVDWVVTRVRGHRAAPTYGRPLSAWQASLRQLGFAVEARPMSQGTPFANVLLVAQKTDTPSTAAHPTVSHKSTIVIGETK